MAQTCTSNPGCVHILVVYSPGIIDIHSHSQPALNFLEPHGIVLSHLSSCGTVMWGMNTLLWCFYTPDFCGAQTAEPTGYDRVYIQWAYIIYIWWTWGLNSWTYICKAGAPKCSSSSSLLWLCWLNAEWCQCSLEYMELYKIIIRINFICFLFLT